jgi:hypothetical protein
MPRRMHWRRRYRYSQLVHLISSHVNLKRCYSDPGTVHDTCSDACSLEIWFHALIRGCASHSGCCILRTAGSSCVPTRAHITCTTSVVSPGPAQNEPSPTLSHHGHPLHSASFIDHHAVAQPHLTFSLTRSALRLFCRVSEDVHNPLSPVRALD